MKNINLVTEHLRKKAGEGETVLTLVPTVSGDPYLTHESGCWRVYDFVEHSLCLQTAETVDDFYQSAVAFGHFEEELKDFPIDELNEVIPDFHNTPNRYRIFHEVLDKDVMNRAGAGEGGDTVCAGAGGRDGNPAGNCGSRENCPCG